MHLGPGMEPKAAADDRNRPTKVVNGKTYVLYAGRWHIRVVRSDADDPCLNQISAPERHPKRRADAMEATHGATLHYSDGRKVHYTDASLALAVYYAAPPKVCIAFRGDSDHRPVYSWDCVGR